ncbi:MAG TPA: Flp pilus assembly protein CpaB, partial [Candidatus Sulfopaludibacter sp.]|nr:Flp pilus assembly protein CpaB [Candidatus Sulfopaludibacter sp.]
AGFVLPGMRVDVLMTGRPPNGTDTETQTVLQNIAVLSAGQTIQTDAKQTDAKSQAIVAPVVTLLVSPREAESLALANNEGHIQLVLRNSTDRTVVATTGRRLHELYGATALQAAGPSAAPAAGPKPVVRVAAGHRAATVAAPPVPVPAAVEPDQMIVIRGSVKKVEYFSREQEGK